MAKSNYIRALAILAAMAAALVAVMMSHPPVSAATPIDTLKQPPFPPTDTGLFAHGVYPESPPEASPTSGPTGEATLRRKLEALLVKRFGSGSIRVSQGLAKFDAASTKRVVPDPRLRAALVALKGTAGEPAIAGTLDGTYSTVRFGTTSIPNRNAEVRFPCGSCLPEIIFNKQLQYEDFRLMSGTLAHEALHRDLPDSGKEELIANALDTLVYGQVLLESPELATLGTKLARQQNTDLLARINSRDTAGNLRLLVGNGNVFPNSPYNLPYYAARFEPLEDNTRGSLVLTQMVKRVVGGGVTLPSTVHFNNATVALLDKNQRLLTPRQLVRLAWILKLDTSPPSAAEARRAQEAEETVPSIPNSELRRILGDDY